MGEVQKALKRWLRRGQSSSSKTERARNPLEITSCVDQLERADLNHFGD